MHCIFEALLSNEKRNLKAAKLLLLPKFGKPS